jgi:N-carbamoylputrescine amidase
VIAEAGRSTDAVVVADLDLDMIRDVRNVWQFYRDRRPEMYNALTAP